VVSGETTRVRRHGGGAHGAHRGPPPRWVLLQQYAGQGAMVCVCVCVKYLYLPCWRADSRVCVTGNQTNVCGLPYLE